MNKSVLLILLFILFPFLIHAQNPDAELISQRTNITVKNGKLIQDYYYEIKINNRQGESFAEISIPHSNLFKVDKIEAHIEDAEGKIIKKLKKKDITERSLIAGFSLYEDNFLKEFTLLHNIYPYTIVYSYQVTEEEFLYIANWRPVIGSKVPTRNASLRISIPSNYKINYSNFLVEDPKIETLANEVIYTWQTSYTDFIKQEVFSPSVTSLLPRVSVTPEQFVFDAKGSFKDWVSYGNWQCNLLEGLTELPQHEQNRVSLLIKDIKDDREKIRALYHYLQDETRYVNVSIGTGGMRPYPSEYVARNKYGDCKALTNYFKSLLDFAGIKSYYTNIYAGSPIRKVNENFPSQQFNHAIIYIPLNGEDIWLDLTTKNPFNYLGTFTQNRDVFVIDDNNSHFLKTPALSKNDVHESRKIKVEYKGNKTEADFKNRYKGKKFESLIQIEKGYDNTDKLRIIKNYFTEDGFNLTDYQIKIPDRDSVYIDLNYTATSQSLYKQYGNDLVLSNIGFSMPQFEKPTTRKTPMQIDYPIYKTDTLVYAIPDGYKLNSGYQNLEEKTRFGAYSFRVAESENEIKVIKSLYPD